jgi:hypothetical protein
MEVMKETQSKASSPCLNDSREVWAALMLTEFIGSPPKKMGEMGGAPAVQIPRLMS